MKFIITLFASLFITSSAQAQTVSGAGATFLYPVYAKMINAAGNTVSDSLESFQNAASSANWNAVAGFGVSLTNDSGTNSWPITSPTFILLPRNPVNKDVNAAVIKFFEWTFDNGDQLAIDLAYVPLPKDVKSLIRQKFVVN